ncbi:hypothetical protein CEE37_09525 [candidate division LCP-89 bacterium B3_LCP]|uniref:Cation transporter n=1 Tax=candidate division LCP-89 bacterium B3_LCP TaxID=2012998 RepID=A0A532UYH4_UNCL8|nr:MAG: hypothetical protein CEE37_09525 [candidate division LCP-89 bacterium B3_LCP]
MGRELLVIDTRTDKKNTLAAVEKFRVALISVGAALFLTGAKLIVGVWTGSLALISEAAHSGLDLFASIITMFAVRAADRPPDKTHHYGHGKIESLSALFESLLLIITCLWILKEAIHRFSDPGSPPQVNVYSFAVVLTAIVIDWYRYRALIKTARKHRSQALEADALHFYSDIISSSFVLLGLAAVSLGYIWADALAAILVIIWVGILAVRLGKRNVDVLADRVPEGYAEKIATLTLGTDGVLSVDQLRLRRSGSAVFADLRIGLDRSFSLAEAHNTKKILLEKLASHIPGLDAVIHANPKTVPGESLELGILNFIKTQGLQAHNLTLRRREEKFVAELHLEFSGELTIGEAHRTTDELEKLILSHFPEICDIQIHIEDICKAAEVEVPLNNRCPDIVEQIGIICDKRLGKDKCHSVVLGQLSGKISVAMHCLFPVEMTVHEVHIQTTELEEELRKEIRELHDVLIHAEPDFAIRK